MAWTLEEQHQKVSDGTYANRISMAFLETAFDVVNESEETPQHEERLVLANKVIKGDLPPRAVQILHILNPALQVDNPTDSDILFTVSQQWNFFAIR